MENARNVKILCDDGSTVLIKEIALQPHRSSINFHKDLIVYGYYDATDQQVGTEKNRKRKKREIRVKIRMSLCQTTTKHAATLLASEELANVHDAINMDIPQFVAIGTVTINHMLKRGVVNETRLGGKLPNGEKCPLLYCVVSTFVSGYAMFDVLERTIAACDIEELADSKFALIDIAEDGTCPSAPNTWFDKKSVYADIDKNDGTRPTLDTLPDDCPPSEFVVWRILAHLAPFTCTDPGVRSFYQASMFTRTTENGVFLPVENLNALCKPGLSFFSYKFHQTTLRTVHDLHAKLDNLSKRELTDDPVANACRKFFLHAGTQLIAPLIAATNSNKFLWLDASPHNILLQ